MVLASSDENEKTILRKYEIVGLVNEISRVFGSGSGIILNYAGFEIRRSIAEEYITKSEEAIFEAFRKIFEERGFGKVSIEMSGSSKSIGKITFFELPFPIENPLHEILEMLVRGIFQGFLAKSFKTNKIPLTKEQCVTKGDDVCALSFKIEES